MLQMLGYSLVFGVVVYLIALPFVILAMVSSFYRERFQGCLQLKRRKF